MPSLHHPRHDVVQTTFGVYHHFELARELQRRERLRTIYSTWPWWRLKREGLPKELVQTFPWLHTAEYALHKSGVSVPWITDGLGYWNAKAFDEWTHQKLVKQFSESSSSIALIALAGSSLKTGQAVQEAGGRFICDSGSTHARYQMELLTEERRRWGLEGSVGDTRDMHREEAIYAEADGIVVPSSVAARSFHAMGVDPSKIQRIPYGVRLETFYPEGTASASSFDVLFVGHIGLRKGVPYLLEAFARFEHPRKRLWMVGDVAEDMRALMPRMPLEDVEFLGTVSQAELRARMSRSHVMVLPSLEEGMAMVQAQAMACGCPVIGSVNSGAEDLFQDGVEGGVVPVRDPAAILGWLERLAGDRSLRESMREAGLARVRRMGGWREYGDRWEAFLDRLMGSPHADADAVSAT